MKSLNALLFVVVMLVMVGCSSGLKILQKPNATDRLAIVMFTDCNGPMDCPGSGKKITDIYSEVLGVPVVMFESDAKGFDVLLTGNIVNYNEAVPMAGNVNIVMVDLRLKRVSDNTLLIKQSKQAFGSNLFSSTIKLSRSMAEDLKESMK
jgi:hypothetical protein